MEKVKSWLKLQPANPSNINITEALDYEGNAVKNRIWYRGDGYELQQLYGQINLGGARQSFWAATPSPGMEINKIHTGLPALIVDTLTTVTLSSLNDVEIKNLEDQKIWDEINKENKFKKRLERAVKETLYIGDGAFKVSFDKDLSKYSIIEYFPGDRIEYTIKRGRVTEVIFKTVYRKEARDYVLKEYYGYGYIRYKLFYDGKEVPVDGLEETKGLVDVAFSTYSETEEGPENGEYMLAVPIMFFESGRWEGRGQSIYDRKVEAFDALDEAWSQWMDALRAGRSKEYIPECLIPRDPETGALIKQNAFDNRFIETESDIHEGAKNQIELIQPAIPHESYLATYTTALDMCLQGIISPSTLGIDMKKLDNADAQREKEKATLYSRDAIVNALTEDLATLVSVAVRAYKEFTGAKNDEPEVTVTFGEYANPSFEAQVETVGKGRAQGIISIEASVDTLYGDTKEEDWKKEEVARLKAEQGIVEMEEPAVNKDAIDFGKEKPDEGESGEKSIPDEPGKVSGAPEDSK